MKRKSTHETGSCKAKRKSTTRVDHVSTEKEGGQSSVIVDITMARVEMMGWSGVSVDDTRTAREEMMRAEG